MSRNYDEAPTEYGRVRDNRRNPITGRPMPPTTAQRTQPMRSEAFPGQGTVPKRDRLAPNRVL